MTGATDKIKRALEQCFVPDLLAEWDIDCELLARVALEAIHEPTLEMKAAAMSWRQFSDQWDAAIRAALNDG